MTNSFLLYKGASNIDLASYCRRLTTFNGQADIHAFDQIQLGFSFPFEIELQLSIEGYKVFLLPTAYNPFVRIEQIKSSIQSILTKQQYELSIDNLPSFLAIHEERQQVLLFSNAQGWLPIYYGSNSKGDWITTEAKAFIQSEDFDLKLRDFEFFNSLTYTAPTETRSMFEQLNRLGCHQLLELNTSGFIIHEVTHSNPFDEFDFESETESIVGLYDVLADACDFALQQSEKNALALSGGYDSGALSGFLHQANAEFETFTIGTSSVNEFIEAKTISARIDVKNTPILIESSSYLKHYLHSVFVNEINDALIAEGFVALHAAYQGSSEKSTDLFSGYGADILLGNLLQVAADEINEAAHFVLKRCALSGELSPFIVDTFHLRVHPVFLNSKVAFFCKQLLGSLKIKNDINKYLEYKMILANDLMPAEMLKIKKLGIHEGAGLPTMFAHHIGCATDDYQSKRKFLYRCLKALFEEGIAWDALNTNELILETTTI